MTKWARHWGVELDGEVRVHPDASDQSNIMLGWDSIAIDELSTLDYSDVMQRLLHVSAPRSLPSTMAKQVDFHVKRLALSAASCVQLNHSTYLGLVIKAYHLLPKLVLVRTPDDPHSSHRLDLFRRGKFSELATIALGIPAHEKSKSTSSPTLDSKAPKYSITEKRSNPKHRRAAYAIGCGQASAAMEILRRFGGPSKDQSDRIKIIQQTPVARTKPVNPRTLISPKEHAPPPPSKKSFRQLLRQSSKLSAGGPSGWSFSLMRSVESGTVDFLSSLFLPFTTNNLDTTATSTLTLARGICIPKKDGGVRPLTIGESIRRLLCRSVIQIIGNDDIEHAAGLYQCAAGTKAGTDIAGIISKLALETAKLVEKTTDNWVLLSIDCRAAFQHIDREWMIEQIRLKLPQFYGACLAVYGSPSTVLLANDPRDPTSRVTSSEGVHQGCPMGTIFFSIGIALILEDIIKDIRKLDPMNSGSAFADDITLILKKEHAAAGYQLAVKHLERIGLQVNPSKTTAYCSSPCPTHDDFFPCNHDKSKRFAGYEPSSDVKTYIDRNRNTHNFPDSRPPPFPSDPNVLLDWNGLPAHPAYPRVPTLIKVPDFDEAVQVVTNAWTSEGITIAGTPIGTEAYILKEVFKKI